MQHIRDVGHIHLQGAQIVFQIGEALDVLLHLLVLRIGHEHDAVHAAQHELTGGVVNDLARNGVKLELGFESLDRHGLDRQEIEEQRAVGAGRQRDQFALLLRRLNVFVDFDQVGRLAAHGWTVIHNFDLQLFGGLVDDSHKRSLTCSAGPIERQ